MSSFRKFHSIAALCGDGLRPELQALFERLAVDPHSELFARDDGMVQSGPDPVAAEVLRRESETRISTADSTRDVVFSRKFQPLPTRPKIRHDGMNVAMDSTADDANSKSLL
jgi:hypothetical protein